MTTQRAQLSGQSCRIDGKWYRLFRQEIQEALKTEFQSEPPWTTGYSSQMHPVLVSEPTFTWHSGGFKSRQGIPGTSESGQNSDSSRPFALGPAALTTVLSLASATVAPTSIFAALGYIFVCVGRYVYRVNPADDVVTLSKDFGAGKVAVMGLRWESDYGLVCTADDTQSLWKVTAIGTPDTWTQSADVVAYRLAAGINRLYKVSKVGVLKQLASGQDPMTEANWGDDVQVGDTYTAPTGMVSYERTVFVAKQDGIYGVGEEGFGVPFVRRVDQSTNTGKGMTVIDPWVYIPHAQGLYRFQPGTVQSVGLEREIMNESGILGTIVNIQCHGQTIYAWLWTGTAVYVLKGREKNDNESGFGPLVWDTFLYYSSTLSPDASYVSNLTDPMRIWFSYGDDIAYIKEPHANPVQDHADYRFALSAIRYTYKYRFDDWGDKDFQKFRILGSGLSATVKWAVAYSINGGAWQTTDINGATMELTTDTMHEFILPTTATGREIQYRFTYTSNSTTTNGKLVYFEPFAVIRPRQVEVFTVQLQLETNIQHDHARDNRTALDQYLDLKGLLTQAASVLTTGYWGDDISLFLKNLSVSQVIQTANNEPGFIVNCIFQKRNAS